MKVTSKFIALALAAVAMVFASCSKDDDSAQKGAENFSHDIIGMWEGVEKTGDETKCSAEARIAYFADGTYIQYSKVTDVWVPRYCDASEYVIEGNKLTTRWKPEHAENYISEWWNIDAIKNGAMKWSASRKHDDGSQYTSTFTWKKVDDTLTSEQIMAKLPGTWANIEQKSINFLKGEVIKTEISPLDSLMTNTFTNDGKCLYTLPAIGEFTEKVIEYTYTVKGNVLTLMEQGEAAERDIKDIRVVKAISDDELILIQYEEMFEELIDMFGHDAFLTFIRLKKVK